MRQARPRARVGTLAKTVRQGSRGGVWWKEFFWEWTFTRAHRQSLCDTANGVIERRALDHRTDDVRAFYQGFHAPAVVGLEATGYARWFHRLVEETGHQLLIGDARRIRQFAARRRKNDRRDSELLLDLLLHGDFPAIHIPSIASQEVLRLLRYRHRLVGMRTMLKNGLQVVMLSNRMLRSFPMGTLRWRQQLEQLPLVGADSIRREHSLPLMDEPSLHIDALDKELERRSQVDVKATLLQTHPGVELSVTKPKSQEAYELYLRSQDSVYWSMARNKDAIALLEKSVKLDPEYAPAWLALGLHYSNEADFASGGEQMHNKTIAALERASQLDSGLLLPQIELIEREAFYGDVSASFARVQEVARRWPRRAEVHHVFSGVLRAAGALEQAARECEATHQLDPELPTNHCHVLYIHMGDLVKARQEIERSPGQFSTMMQGQVLVREGRVEEALPKLKMIPGGKSFELLHDCWPDSSTLKCAKTTKESEADFRIIPFTDAWYFGAAMQAFVGKKDAAVRLLRAASEHGLCVYPSVDRDPLFDKIRDSAEFKAVRQAGIECQKKFAPYARMQIQ
jgi:tetratricopeptide (TPR) repeat protein